MWVVTNPLSGDAIGWSLVLHHVRTFSLNHLFVCRRSCLPNSAMPIMAGRPQYIIGNGTDPGRRVLVRKSAQWWWYKDDITFFVRRWCIPSGTSVTTRSRVGNVGPVTPHVDGRLIWKPHPSGMASPSGLVPRCATATIRELSERRYTLLLF